MPTINYKLLTAYCLPLTAKKRVNYVTNTHLDITFPIIQEHIFV